MKLKPLLTEECTNNATFISSEIRGENGGTISFLEQSLDITVRFVETDGLVRVMLEIGDKTTHKDIRDAIPNILKWRDEVQEKQSDKNAYRLLHKIQKPSNKDELLELFSQLQEHGVSYTKLAERFNAKVIKLLEVILRDRQKSGMSTEELIAHLSLYTYLNNLIDAMNIRDIDLGDAIEKMATGKPPFEKGDPISRFKMIEVLRTWRKSKLHIAIQNALKKTRGRASVVKT